MKLLKALKITFIICTVYNCWLLVTTNYILKKIMYQLALLDYNGDLFSPLLSYIAPTLRLIPGWITFFIVILQLSCLSLFLTTRRMAYFMTSCGLIAEGLIYILNAETRKQPSGVWNPGLVLIVAGISY